jgi:quinoprotein glucose dehydrogenase
MLNFRFPFVIAILFQLNLIGLAALGQDQIGSATPNQQQKDRLPALVDAELAIKRLQIPANLTVDLWAAEPMLQNPVAFNFDEKGRAYVCETFRLKHGVDDIREIMDWLDEELAARTVDDRLAEMKRHLGEKLSAYTEASERVRVIEDQKREGKASRSTVFAEKFDSQLDGIGAGVLPRKGNVWYASIPNLWLLRDTNADGVADVRKSLHYGFGVRVGFLGHDLHGLHFGPDGKLYFSIGDRGSNIRVAEGKYIGEPDCGCVFRCNPDGTELEVFAYGLRNPQDLVFDEFGNLFTGDNNSDSGDEARWVYLVEGSDNGWRVGYQFMENPYSRGPFNAEKLWHPPFPGQAGYIVPPVANISSGPSGVAYFPGTGLPDLYRGHFFLVDFRGGAANSGIHTFTLKPKGAGFELANPEHFIWNTLATDVKFSPSGGIYWSDWVDGWGLPNKGRLYRAHNLEIDGSAIVRETARLLAEGMEKRSLDELGKLLAHPDMRVRQEAQFELADRGASGLPALERTLRKSSSQLARLHAIWGIGQILARDVGSAGKTSIALLLEVLSDHDGEVRAQSAKVLGERKVHSAREKLCALLKDPAPRVRFFAALSLGKLGQREAALPVIDLLRENNDADPWLRHAGVMALVGLADMEALSTAAKDPSSAVRMGALLAMRRMQRPEAAGFLKDKEPRIVLEAARAINDQPINGAMADLAGLLRGLDPTRANEALIRRVLNANYHFGTAASAKELAAFVVRKSAPANMQVEAVEELANWQHPSGRDRVIGLWRPVAAHRPLEDAAAAFEPIFPELAESAPAEVKLAAFRAAASLALTNAGPGLLRVFENKNNPGGLRAEALKTLALLHDPSFGAALQSALTDSDEKLRQVAIPLSAAATAAGSVSNLAGILEHGSIGDQQAALATLGTMRTPQAERLLLQWVKKLQAAEVPKEIQLDLINAAEKQETPAIKAALVAYQNSKPKDDALSPFIEALYGGDTTRGKQIFFERADAQCVRCHKIGGQGGDVGPDLSHVSAQKDRRYLLESIVLPNQQIAPGFDSVMVTLKNDESVAGVLKSENETSLVINSPQSGLVTVKKNDIQSRRKSLSPMPEGMGQILSRKDLRDLVEFLSAQR